MHAGFVLRRRIKSGYCRLERYLRLSTSRYVGCCLEPLSLGLSLALESPPWKCTLRRYLPVCSHNRMYPSGIAGRLRFLHGDRLMVLYGRGVATMEIAPRGAIL